jgi:hypothetical protein
MLREATPSPWGMVRVRATRESTPSPWGTWLVV